MPIYDYKSYKEALDSLVTSVTDLFKSPVPEADRADSVNQFNGKTAEQYIDESKVTITDHVNRRDNPHHNTPETLGAYDNVTIQERLTHTVPEGRIPISSYGLFGYDKLPMKYDNNDLTVTIPPYGCILAGYFFMLDGFTYRFQKGEYKVVDVYIRYRRGKAEYLLRDASKPKLPDTYVTMYLGIIRYQEYGGVGSVMPSPVRLDVYRPNSFGYTAMAIPASNNGTDTTDHIPKAYLEESKPGVLE